MTPVYRVVESVRFRSGRGIRRMGDYPSEANLVLDRSAIHRIRSNPAEHADLVLYRLENVIEFLATQPDLEAYLAGLGLAVEVPVLPRDVLDRIEKMRTDRTESGEP